MFRQLTEGYITLGDNLSPGPQSHHAKHTLSLVTKFPDLGTLGYDTGVTSR